MADPPEQLDPFLFNDVLQDLNRALRREALDLGARFLGDAIHQKASTIQNQLTDADDRRPSFDLAVAVAFHNKRFRELLCNRLCPPPSIEAPQAIEEIERDILPALGEHDAKALRNVLRRVKKGSR